MGSHELIEIGDISVQKEWTFAGNMVDAILMLVRQENIYEAVIGSGKPYTIEYWLQCCFDVIGKNWRDYITLRPGFMQKYSLLLSDPTLIKRMGWNPKVGIEELARIMVMSENE